MKYVFPSFPKVFEAYIDEEEETDRDYSWDEFLFPEEKVGGENSLNVFKFCLGLGTSTVQTVQSVFELSKLRYTCM